MANEEIVQKLVDALQGVSAAFKELTQSLNNLTEVEKTILANPGAKHAIKPGDFADLDDYKSLIDGSHVAGGKSLPAGDETVDAAIADAKASDKKATSKRTANKKEEPPAPAAPAMTRDDVVKALSGLKPSQVKAALTQLGAATLPDLDVSKYAEFVAVATGGAA